jgi:DNA repair exonuclease SbcCD ATPase subunit
MKQPKQPFEPPEEENLEADFEQEIEEVQQAVFALKERYKQVETDRFLQAELQQRLVELNQYKYKTKELKAELKQIKQQLEVLEVSLESQLFSLSSFKEPFWQAIRFGGLGVIIGWMLKSCAG